MLWGIHRGINSLEVTESLCCWFPVGITKLQHSHVSDGKSLSGLPFEIAAYWHKVLYLHKLFQISTHCTRNQLNCCQC